jgi:hypothetical protein
MKIKGRILEVGSDGHHPYIRIHVQDIKDVRLLASKLYDYVEISPEVNHPTAPHMTDAHGDPGCLAGHYYLKKSERAVLLTRYGLCWICQEEAMREELAP